MIAKQSSKNHREALKWEVPELIDLTRPRKQASGACQPTGSGDIFCIGFGSGAVVRCNATGVAADFECTDGSGVK